MVKNFIIFALITLHRRGSLWAFFFVWEQFYFCNFYEGFCSLIQIVDWLFRADISQTVHWARLGHGQSRNYFTALAARSPKTFRTSRTQNRLDTWLFLHEVSHMWFNRFSFSRNRFTVRGCGLTFAFIPNSNQHLISPHKNSGADHHGDFL